MALTEGAETLKTILSSDWQKSNTNSRTPLFEIEKKSGKRADWKISDVVRIKPLRTLQEPNGLGANSIRIIESFIVELRTSFRDPNETSVDTKIHTHAFKILKEVDRIVKANINGPHPYYNIMEPGNWEDRSENTNNMGLYTYEVRLIKLNDTF